MKKIVTLSAFALLLSGCSLDIFGGDDDKKDSDKDDKKTAKVEEFKGDLEALGLDPEEDKEISDFIFYSRDENEADNDAEEEFNEDFGREESYSYMYTDEDGEVYLALGVSIFDYEDFDELFDEFIAMSEEKWEDDDTDFEDLDENFNFGDGYKAYMISDSEFEGYAIAFHRKNVLVNLAVGSEDDSYEDYLDEVEDILEEIDSRIEDDKELKGDDFADADYDDDYDFGDEDEDYDSVDYDAEDTQRVESYDGSVSVEIPVALEYTGLDLYEYDGGPGSGVRFEITSDFNSDPNFDEIDNLTCNAMADQFESSLVESSGNDLDFTQSVSGKIIDFDGVDACLVDTSFETQGFEFFVDVAFFVEDSYLYTVQLMQTEDLYESDLIDNIIDSARV